MLGSIRTILASEVVCFNGVQTIYGNGLIFLKAGCSYIRILFLNEQSVFNCLNTLRYYNIQCRVDKLLLVFCQSLVVRIFIQCCPCSFSLSICQIRIVCFICISAQLRESREINQFTDTLFLIVLYHQIGRPTTAISDISLQLTAVIISSILTHGIQVRSGGRRNLSYKGKFYTG